MPAFLPLRELCSGCPKLLPHLLCGGVSDLLKGNGDLCKAEVSHSAEGCCASHTKVDCRDHDHMGTKKLDLKSNCTTSTA